MTFLGFKKLKNGTAIVYTDDKTLDGKFWLNPHSTLRQILFREPVFCHLKYKSKSGRKA